MKALLKICSAAAILAAVFTAAVAVSRQPGAQQPAAGAGAIPAGKVAVVDSEVFADQKAGVARILAAYATIEREFKPRRDELQSLRARYDAIAKELSAPAAGATQAALAAKVAEGERIKTDIDRKQEDGQRAYQRRWNELTGPLFSDINNALREYARQRDVTVVVDISKLSGAVLVANDAVNITQAFIADYNRRNPAPAGAAAPATPARP